MEQNHLLPGYTRVDVLASFVFKTDAGWQKAKVIGRPRLSLWVRLNDCMGREKI